jgi:hypothetical protein
VRTGFGVRPGSGEVAGVGEVAGAGTGAGTGVGAGVADAGRRASAGTGAVRDGASGDDGNGAGRGFPGGSLSAERRTEHSTSPQKVVCVGGRPPESWSRTIPAEPPSKTSPAAAHSAGYRPRVTGRAFLRPPDDGSPPPAGSAESADDPSGIWSPLTNLPRLLDLASQLTSHTGSRRRRLVNCRENR